MKLLLLSCATGEGHNSAAYALSEAADRMGIEWVLEDPVSFGGARAKTAVSSVYNNMIKRSPKLFGAVYKAGDLFEKTGWTSPVYFANALYAKNLGDYLTERKIDAVIATHLYGMEAMTAVRKRTGNKTPFYGVLTDYTPIPFFTETTPDGFFLPHPDLVGETVEKGAPAEKIFPLGIPVSARFAERQEKNAARNYLVLPKEKKIYLLMSGGVGCEYVQDLCDALCRAEAGDFSVCVLAGRNEEMRDRLQDRYHGDPRVRIITFTKQVNVYMKAADVMLSKPGGLSSTEAAVAGIPLVHVGAIPGCETKNAAFFSARGMSVYASDVQRAAQEAIRLANDTQAAEEMIRRQRQNTFPRAAERILQTVVQNHA